MKIKLFPFLTNETLVASVFGDSLWLNDEEIDLSAIPEGYRLPACAIDSPWLSASDPIERVGGVISLTLKFPVTWDSPDALRIPPEPIVLAITRGDVRFPSAEPQKLERTVAPQV
ncbi:hypothetical protein K0P33_07625 [Pseudomonas sp. ArH3a]|uniref:hypothetical protein n=1 Tax=Pseudomonas TaxID=286 RepID=UPI000BA12ACF|nr:MULTISPECIES: hypothetical protein [unclassified Pseudomonas]MCV2229720.1 hypothetical protein [Pseudomonas sp. AU10]OZO05118.1 hypothetical protein B7453_07300 [Pseudomonas sp. IB20]UNM21316.1 hypothetical protein K0P33_07625 [Pseudomonas sp. ArH3a]